jgi:hypothetical protein
MKINLILIGFILIYSGLSSTCFSAESRPSITRNGQRPSLQTSSIEKLFEPSEDLFEIVPVFTVNEELKKFEIKLKLSPFQKIKVNGKALSKPMGIFFLSKKGTEEEKRKTAKYYLIEDVTIHHRQINNQNEFLYIKVQSDPSITLHLKHRSDIGWWLITSAWH